MVVVAPRLLTSAAYGEFSFRKPTVTGCQGSRLGFVDTPSLYISDILIGI